MIKKSFFITGCLFMLLSLLPKHSVTAQTTPQKHPTSPIICPAKFEDMHTRVSIPDSEAFQRSKQRVATAQFDITFGPGAQANPDAIAAFEFALDIWAAEIVSSIPIKIFADFADLGPGVLASAGPTYLVSDFPNAPEPEILYPPALANALANDVLFPDEEFDLIVNLGNGIDWYFGTDGNTPAGLYDFVTVALHEAGHGLGFTTIRSYTDGTGSLLASNGQPAIYSLFMVDGEGTPLLNFPDPSIELGDAFTGGDLFMDGAFAKAALGGERPELYAPSTFQGGSSLAHWDEATFPAGDPNSLMTPQAGSAESNFDIGNITRGLFKDMGWVLNDSPIVSSPLNLSEELFIDNSITKTIVISNVGSDTIEATITTNSNASTIESITPDTLTIASTESASFDVLISSTGLSKGIYNDSIFVTTNNDDTLTIPVTVRVIDGTEVPIIEVSPPLFDETLQQFQIVTKDLVIDNTGDDDLNYSISINDNSTPSFSSRVKTTKEAISTYGFTMNQFSNSSTSMLSSAITTTDGNFNSLVTSLYATDFEDFSLGDINNQQGWIGQYPDNWVITDTNAFEGGLHLRGISDGLGGDRPGNILAISPSVTPGNSPFMVASAKINIQGSGVSWEFIPQSPTAGSVNTRLRFNGDGSIDVLAGSGFTPIDAITPTGYFDLRIVVDKADSSFSVYFDNEKVFDGLGFAPEIEQLVFLSDMAVEGSTIDVDNLEITDGDSEAFFLSVSPITGTVPFGSSITTNVKFDTRVVDPGQYNATITINSNDEEQPVVDIPVTLNVLVPPTIGVTPDSLSTSVDVQIDIPPVKTKTFTISNSGESPLEFSTSLGATDYSPSNTRNIPLSELNMKDYGVGNTGVYQLKSAGLSKEQIINKTVLNNSFIATDSIYYDSELEFPDDFVGLVDLPITVAVKFDTTSDFTLSAVRNAYKTTTLTNPTIILEIYRGGNTPNNGDLLLTQTFTQESPEGVFATEVLNESFNFSAGESFWVVHKYPLIDFPQGIDSAAAPRANTYFFSSDGGETYSEAGFVFLTRALSGGSSENYITLEPSTGIVDSGESIDVTASFDGESLANGIYNTDIIVSSNDPVTPRQTVSTNFEVSGQTSEIAISDELLLFNSTFLGASKELAFTIQNNGLASLSISSISSDNSDFTLDMSSAVIAPNESLDVNVTFTPTALGSINGIITIESDATNTNLSEVIVNGIGVDPPVAVLDPSEVSETVNAGDSIDSTISLKNEGNSPLTFSFPDLAVAAALANPNVKLNNTKRIEFSGFKASQDKGVKDTRVGTPVLYSIGTDNEFGYRWIDSDEAGGPVYNFMDITATGTNITGIVGADGTTTAPLSFPFEFYGSAYSTVYINSNGFISFQEPNTTVTWVNTQIPLNDNINNIIAGFWDDLEPQNFNGAVHYEDFGDHFIIQWTQNTVFFGSENETVTFQIVLYNDGTIDIFYEDVETASFDTNGTVGIENADGTDGAQVAFNTEYIKNGLALRFIKPDQPLTNLISNVSPLSGVVAAGRTKELTVTLDASSLNDGVYYDELIVSSNDPVNMPKTLFELTVIGFPEITVTPDSLSFEPIFIGLNSRASVLIQNTGTKTLDITNISNTNTDFVLDLEAPFVLTPGASRILFVDFTPTTIGTIEDTITIVSNDAFGNDSFTVPITGVGVDPPVAEVNPEAFEYTVIRGDSINDSLSLTNTGGSTLNYVLSTPFFVKANDPEAKVKELEYPKFEYAKIESKEAEDTRVGPAFLNVSGGSGTFGYSWTDSNSGGPAYDFIDISSIGQIANVGGDGNINTELPFDFTFFGEVQNEVYISANGFITFAPIVGIDFINAPIPNSGNPNLLIAGLWDDIEPQNGDGVFYYGTKDYFIVQYENTPGYGFPGPDPVTFQIIIFPDGSIKLQYKNVDSAIRTSSTVGLEGPQGLLGLQVIFNNEFLTNELAITFTPPISGDIEPNASVDIPIEIKTRSLEPEETYTGDIKVISNDPVNNELIVPVTLNVLRGPEVLSFTLIDALTNKEIGVINDGDSIDLDDYRFNKFYMLANTGTADVGSVVFDYNETTAYRIDNRAPFTLREGRFNPITFPVGSNTITATPYTENNGEGIYGDPYTISFEVFRTNTTNISSFTLIDANTHTEIGIINDGDVIDLSNYNDNKFSIVANIEGLPAGSVVFDFNEKASFNVENFAPFSLNGDYKFFRQRYKPVSFNKGVNTLTATPYFKKYGRGEKGNGLSISFDVIENIPETFASKTINNAAVSNIQLNPNPVSDYAYLSLNTKLPKLKGYIYNFSGVLVHQMDIVVTNHLVQKQINIGQLEKGIYLLVITDDFNKIQTKMKVVKN